MKIFPTQRDGNGKLIFPTLDITKLRESMNGRLVNGNGNAFNRVYNGNLIVSGTKAAPFTVRGEVFIDGDLIIKGYYKGIGTIYARNVFVVDDIISMDCLPGGTTCPYPFAGTDEEIATKARDSIRDGRAALYLGAVGSAVMGDLDFDVGLGLTPPTPYSWLPGTTAAEKKASYESLGRHAEYVGVDANNNGIIEFAEAFRPNGAFISDPYTDGRVTVEVQRIDAYVYAHDLFAWRTYGNYLLNGGFVGYKAVLISGIPVWVWRNYNNTTTAVNLRNGLNAGQNVIRYDYRLRYGGAGFEALKAVFDQ